MHSKSPLTKNKEKIEGGGEGRRGNNTETNILQGKKQFGKCDKWWKRGFEPGICLTMKLGN